MLDVAEIMGIVDAFVIVHASNTRLVRAIVDEVKAQLLDLAGVKPRSVEGLDDTHVGAPRLRRSHRARVPRGDARVLRARTPLDRRAPHHLERRRRGLAPLSPRVTDSPDAVSKRVLIAACVALAVVATACSSSSKSTGSATTTTVPADPAPYAKKGPYAVGVTTLHLAGGRKLVVWYPANKATTAGHAQDSVDVGEHVESRSAGARARRISHQVRERCLHRRAARDRRPANTRSVIFSHGFAGYPEQSVTLTTHLASWGFVVAAPNHVERSLDGLLGTAGTGVPKSTDLAVLHATIALVVKASNGSGVLHGLVDPDRLVAAGHSAGAASVVPLRVRRPADQGLDLVLGRVRRRGWPRARAAEAAGHGDARHDRRHHPGRPERERLRRR